MFRYSLCFASCLLLTSWATADESITVSVVGTLKTGIVAIGGETTGSTITANKVTWELDFGKNADLRALAEKLNGKQVAVTGSLEVRAGVEVKQRWIVTVSSLKAADGDRKAEPKIGAEGFREGTTIGIVAKHEQTLVEIKCERGIDRCDLKRVGTQWPSNVVLQLRLKGLESLKVTTGNRTLEWSVASTGANESHCTLISGKRVAQLNSESPLYTVARLVSTSDKPNAQIPLANGHFEVPLPAKLFEDNPEQIHLQWIDFYR